MMDNTIMASQAEGDIFFEKHQIQGTITVTIDDNPPIFIDFKTRLKVELSVKDSQDSCVDPGVAGPYHDMGVEEILDAESHIEGDEVSVVNEGCFSPDNLSLSVTDAHATDGLPVCRPAIESDQEVSDVADSVEKLLSVPSDVGENAAHPGETPDTGLNNVASTSVTSKLPVKTVILSKREVLEGRRSSCTPHVRSSPPAGSRSRLTSASHCHVSKHKDKERYGRYADVHAHKRRRLVEVSEKSRKIEVSSSKKSKPSSGVVKKSEQSKMAKEVKAKSSSGRSIQNSSSRRVQRSTSRRVQSSRSVQSSSSRRVQSSSSRSVQSSSSSRNVGIQSNRRRNVQSSSSRSVQSSKNKSTSSSSSSFSFLSVFQTSTQKSQSKKCTKVSSETGKEAKGDASVGSAKAKAVKVEVKCQYCLRTFPCQQDYLDHRKTPRSESYQCSMCPRVFPFKAFKQAHEKTFHMSVDGKEFNTNDVSNVECDVCGLKVKRLAALKKHLMLHTEEYFYKCCICGRQFLEPGSLKNHMTSHESGGMFRCSCCDQLFATRAALAKHKLATMEVKCHFCGENFPNRTSRTQHYKIFHEKEVIRCARCNAMFSRQEDYAKHAKEHEKYKKKQCTICGKFFSRLEKHMVVHKLMSDMDESEMFVCDKCPRKFTNRSSFQRHLTTHSSEKLYECPNCPRTFADCGVLRKHLRRHSSLMPYECEVCGKRCKELGNLKVHMRIHAETKQFPCPVCPQAFNYKNSLESHMHSRHAQNQDPQSYTTTTFTTDSSVTEVSTPTPDTSELQQVFEAANQLQSFADLEPKESSYTTHTMQPVILEELSAKPVYTSIGNEMSISVPYVNPESTPHIIVGEAQAVDTMSATVPTLNVHLY